MWEVHALAGDRLVHMMLGLRDDGSVFEETRTFLTTDVLDVSFEPDGSTLTVRGPSGLESMPAPEPIGRAVSHPAGKGSKAPSRAS